MRCLREIAAGGLFQSAPNAGAGISDGAHPVLHSICLRWLLPTSKGPACRGLVSLLKPLAAYST